MKSPLFPVIVGLLAFAVTFTTGCAERLTPFPSDKVPSQTMQGVTLQVPALLRTAGRAELRLTIDNQTDSVIRVPRDYQNMTGITVNDGQRDIVTKRSHGGRTTNPRNYVILARERCELDLVAEDPKLSASGPLKVTLTGLTKDDVPLEIVLAIP